MDAAVAAARAALGPNPPQFVPKAALDEALAKVRALQAALDALDTSQYESGATVAAYLEANGLRRPEEPKWAVVGASDDSLLAEVKRRGLTAMVVAAGMRGAAAAQEPTNPEVASVLRRMAATLFERALE